MAAQKISIEARLEFDVKVEVEVDVDSAEFVEWADGKEVTPTLLADFVSSGRDADAIWTKALDDVGSLYPQECDWSEFRERTAKFVG